jgi:hypothetical protein
MESVPRRPVGTTFSRCHGPAFEEMSVWPAVFRHPMRSRWQISGRQHVLRFFPSGCRLWSWARWRSQASRCSFAMNGALPNSFSWRPSGFTARAEAKVSGETLTTQARDLSAVTARATSEAFHGATHSARTLSSHAGQGCPHWEERRSSCRNSHIPT